MNDRRKTGYNSTYTIGGGSVLLMKFSAKNPALRVAAKRYLSFI